MGDRIDSLLPRQSSLAGLDVHDCEQDRRVTILEIGGQRPVGEYPVPYLSVLPPPGRDRETNSQALAVGQIPTTAWTTAI